jgi:hypothetical protein
VLRRRTVLASLPGDVCLRGTFQLTEPRQMSDKQDMMTVESENLVRGLEGLRQSPASGFTHAVIIPAPFSLTRLSEITAFSACLPGCQKENESRMKVFLPSPQCSSGTTQSRPDPARAVKVRQVRGNYAMRGAARYGSSRRVKVLPRVTGPMAHAFPKRNGSPRRHCVSKVPAAAGVTLHRSNWGKFYY